MGAAAIAMAAASAVSSIAAGNQQKKAYESEARTAKIQATQEEAVRSRQLNEALASQNAIMGATGRTPESFASVIGRQITDYNKDIEMVRLGAQSTQAQYKSAGKTAQTMGYINAGAGGASAGLQYSLLGSRNTTPTSKVN